MGNSLRDQLLKVGLVDNKQVKKVITQQRQEKKPKAKKGEVVVDADKLQAQQALAEKVERDRLLNQQHQEEIARKALIAQAKQLIQSHRLTHTAGERAYNFVDDNKVKTLHLDAATHQQLVQGRVCIARLDDAYVLVPSEVAEKIQQRHPASVLQSPTPATPPTIDDPYAAYQVPDDLMW